MTDQHPVEASSPASAALRRTTHPAVAILATALVCLPILGLSQFLAHIRVDEFDAWLFAYYGRELTHGRVLYEQLWDNKPPGIFWINALALRASGGALVGPIVACGAAVVGAWAMFLAATRHLYGLAAACVAAVLAAVYLNQQYFHVGCNRPNTFFVVTELAAFLLYTRAVTSPDGVRRQLLAAGFCAGLGLWFKQTALAVTIAVGVHQALLAIARRQPLRATVRRLLAFAVGWGAAIVLAAVVLFATSDLRWAWDAIVAFNRNYFADGGGSQWWPRWFGVREQVHVLALPAILGLATLLYTAAGWWLRRGRSEPPPPAAGNRPAMLLPMLWVWLAAGAYLAAVGPHQRLPYLGIALPPLCLLAAHGVHLFLSSGRTAGRRYPPYYLFVGVLWFAYMMITPLENQLHAVNFHYYRRFQDPQPDPDAELADFIRSRTDAADTLFVWGYGPEVYWRADRPSALRYIGTEKATQLGAAGQPILDRVIDGLKHTPPRVIVLQRADRARFERGDARDPLDYRDLPRWIRTRYTLAPDAPQPNVWLRPD